MAMTSCQNDEILLSIATAVGRKAYCMGLDIDTNHLWYTPLERDAFMSGWLEAANGASFHGHATRPLSSGQSSSLH